MCQDCTTPTNEESPTMVTRADTVTSIDSQRLSEMLEAMSTPQVLRESKKRTSAVIGDKRICLVLNSS